MDDLDAVEVTRAFLAYCRPLVLGTLTIVTYDCWRTDVGPLEVSAADLPSFAASYPEVYDSAFISGDTTVLSPATGTVILVHHDDSSQRSGRSASEFGWECEAGGLAGDAVEAAVGGGAVFG